MILFFFIKTQSERVKNKNFRLLYNEKLYNYVLNKAQKLNYRIYIDTDNEEVLNINQKNTYAFERKPELLGNNVSANSLIKNFIDKFSFPENQIIAQCHVTTPFFNFSILNDAVKWLEKYDSVFGVTAIKERIWTKKSKDFVPINHNKNLLDRTQDLQTYYIENSTFYLFTVKSFKQTNSRIGDNPYLYNIDFPNNIDIDTEQDWNTVKLLENKLL